MPLSDLERRKFEDMRGFHIRGGYGDTVHRYAIDILNYSANADLQAVVREWVHGLLVQKVTGVMEKHKTPTGKFLLLSTTVEPRTADELFTAMSVFNHGTYAQYLTSRFICTLHCARCNQLNKVPLSQLVYYSEVDLDFRVPGFFFNKGTDSDLMKYLKTSVVYDNAMASGLGRMPLGGEYGRYYGYCNLCADRACMAPGANCRVTHRHAFEAGDLNLLMNLSYGGYCDTHRPFDFATINRKPAIPFVTPRKKGETDKRARTVGIHKLL